MVYGETIAVAVYPGGNAENLPGFQRAFQIRLIIPDEIVVPMSYVVQSVQYQKPIVPAVQNYISPTGEFMNGNRG